MEKMMDKEARDRAHGAMAKITAHEDVCAQRWREAHNTMQRVEIALDKFSRSISNLHNRIWIAAVGVIGALMSVIYFLAGRLI